MEDKTKDTIYDPRAAYEWVPALMASLAVLAKVIAYLIPSIAVFYVEDPKILEQLSQIPGDETFNAILISLVSFWAAKKVADTRN